MKQRLFPISRSVRRDLCPEDFALITGTLQVLADAELVDVAEEFCARVIPPNCRIAKVVGHEYCDDLQPFVELLCRELQHVATVAGWTPAMRRARVDEAFALAGFPPREAHA